MDRYHWRMGTYVLCGMALAGCAAEVGSSSAALSGPDDCRYENRCEGLGPATPLERPPVPPRLSEVPRHEGEIIPIETSGAYRERTSDWIHGAGAFAARHDALAGYPTFVPGREGSHGAVMLWSTAIAWQEQPSAGLFPERGDDVAAMMRHAQAYARSRGYGAALPYFERQDGLDGPVESIALLSPAATELLYVDIAALGARDPSDVVALFAGADRYAVDNGYLGAFPTFELLSDGERVAIGLVAILGDHGYRIDLAEAELSPFCGRWDMPICGNEPICIGGTFGREGFCTTAEPTCGGLGQPCCGGFCENGTMCTFNGLESQRNCDVPETPSLCGNGSCDLGETCSCDKDCGSPPECFPTLCVPDRYDLYCVRCDGEAPRNTVYMSCEDVTFPAGCTGRRGFCR